MIEIDVRLCIFIILMLSKYYACIFI